MTVICKVYKMPLSGANNYPVREYIYKQSSNGTVAMTMVGIPNSVFTFFIVRPFF